MDIFKAMGMSASALQAQRTAIQTISMNLANMHTTGAAGGEPYRRQRAVFNPVPANPRFSELLSTRMLLAAPLQITHPSHFTRPDFLIGGLEAKGEGVTVEIVEDLGDFQTLYDPSHPDADASGYVLVPNINVIEEMVALMSATRSYEANVTAFNAAKGMILKALEIGR